MKQAARVCLFEQDSNLRTRSGLINDTFTGQAG